MNWHHCGTCDRCGGDIPCGADYIRRWRRSGECPGRVNWDGTCGALLAVRPRKRPKQTKSERAEACCV